MNEKIQEFIEFICDDLNIQLPTVSYDTSKFQSDTMLAMCDILNNVIFIKNDNVNLDLLFSISHELRHLWQHKIDKEFYFSEYKNVNELGVKEYNLQVAEIDANAYATIVMGDCFGVRPLYNGIPNDVIVEIEKRVNQIIDVI